MPRPSVVLDTNVIVSAHLKEEGLERFVLDLALARKLQLFLSDEILEEYEGVLVRPAFKLSPAKVAASLRLIEKAATIVYPQKKSRRPRTRTTINSWNAPRMPKPITWLRATRNTFPNSGSRPKS